MAATRYVPLLPRLAPILVVEAGGCLFCYKQALARLAVADEWFAPVERNRSEVEWIGGKPIASCPAWRPRSWASTSSQADIIDFYVNKLDEMPEFNTLLPFDLRKALILQDTGKDIALLNDYDWVRNNLPISD